MGVPKELQNIQSKILPYSLIVGQEALKRSLELAFIEPRIGGVLISGERGTAKSTAVRAFSIMVYRELPVTLPINATEDRVVGGWRIKSLMEQDPQIEPGLLKQANHKLLYIDEVNLLDDHIVNLVLDVTSTGQLVVQREGISEQHHVESTLVGTMNPEEGGLRPQLLDRFGLMVEVKAEPTVEVRKQILRNVLGFGAGVPVEEMIDGEPKSNRDRRQVLLDARVRAVEFKLEDEILERCVRIAKALGAQGHRGEQVMALAARANAALRLAEPPDRKDTDRTAAVTAGDVSAIAQFAIQHRRSRALQTDGTAWSKADQELIDAGGQLEAGPGRPSTDS